MAEETETSTETTETESENLEETTETTTETTTSEETTETKTALEETVEETTETAAPTDWPTDWKDRIAGDDDKVRKRLDRFASPQAIMTSFTNLEKKLNEKGASKFPTEGTDKEKTAWRKEEGIPEEASGYTMPEGLIIGENDKPMIDEFLAIAHAGNQPPAIVAQTLDWYFKYQDAEMENRMGMDEQEKTATRDELQDEYGEDLNRNLGAAFALLEQAPEGVKEEVLGARLKNGTALGNHAPTLRWLTSLAMELNPAATVIPGGGSDNLQTINAELADLEKMMSDRKGDYYTGPKSEGLQKRYRELTDAKNKMAERAK